MWNPDGSIAIVPSARRLLVFPELGECSPPTSHMLVGPHEMPLASCAFKLSFSPCGRLLVGMLGCASEPIQGLKFMNGTAAGAGIPSGAVWQAWTGPDFLSHPREETVSFHFVGGLCSAWLPQSISWHPCPGKYTIYAILDTSCKLLLVDAQHQVCVKMWPWADLIRMCGGQLMSQHHELDKSVRLTWSPCGSQLAVAFAGSLVVLSFDLEAAMLGS